MFTDSLAVAVAFCKLNTVTLRDNNELFCHFNVFVVIHIAVCFHKLFFVTVTPL